MFACSATVFFLTKNRRRVSSGNVQNAVHRMGWFGCRPSAPHGTAGKYPGIRPLETLRTIAADPKHLARSASWRSFILGDKTCSWFLAVACLLTVVAESRAARGREASAVSKFDGGRKVAPC